LDNLVALFQHIDANNDGYLDEEELAIAFRGKKAKPYAQEVESREKQQAESRKQREGESGDSEDNNAAETTDTFKPATKPRPGLNEIKNYPDYVFLTQLDKNKDSRISREEY